MIPIVQPTLSDFEAVIAEFRQAWNSGQVTTGKFTRLFEIAVEEKLKVPHAVMVQSCTAGMMLVLKALELRGEVILPAFTWTSTAHAVVWNGLMPVFADIQPGTYTLDPLAAAKAITPRTVAIMPVNVFGLPPDYQAFEQLGRKKGLPVIYDSAQGLGSQARGEDGVWRYAGSFGDAEIFSLSPTKVVSAMEGGLITTRNGELAGKLRQMRDYGKSSDGEDIAFLGLSARVPEVNAIVARHNFTRVDDLVRRRGELILAYKSALGDRKDLSYQLIPENYLSSGNYFTIFINSHEAPRSRDEVHEYLSRSGIQSKKYFYPALHFQKVYQEIGRPYQGRLPVTEAAATSGLALPLFTHMPEETVFKVSQALKGTLE
ncbi:MAG: DegT/DnrJ/EryC1/StrS family aminotransferase [Desulfobaccales bacterium]